MLRPLDPWQKVKVDTLGIGIDGIGLVSDCRISGPTPECNENETAQQALLCCDLQMRECPLVCEDVSDLKQFVLHGRSGV